MGRLAKALLNWRTTIAGFGAGVALLVGFLVEDKPIKLSQLLAAGGIVATGMAAKDGATGSEPGS